MGFGGGQIGLGLAALGLALIVLWGLEEESAKTLAPMPPRIRIETNA